MKKYMGLVAVVLLVPASGIAQEASRVYTRPAPLSREALERLHLTQAWRAILPVGDRRDGIYSVQFFDDQIIVQTRAGLVAALNAVDGTTQWRKQIGLPFRVTQLTGSNADTLFVTRGSFLHALNRKTGVQRWEFDLPGAPAAPITADEQNLYVSVGVGRLLIYELPQKKKQTQALEAPADKGEVKPATAYGGYSVRNASSGPEPTLVWEYGADDRIESAPILTDDLMVVGAGDGSFVVSSKLMRKTPFQFKATAPLSAPLASYSWRNTEGHLEQIVYVASEDSNLYALDVTLGKILWRFTGAGPIHRKPRVTDENIYLIAEHAGLYRLKRESGESLWRNAKARRYLSSNKKFVYAADSVGRLLVLDRVRGTEQASFDTSGYTVPVSNEGTDRLFLASTDGQLVCLHDRDYPTPLVMKTPPAPPKPEKAPGDKAADGDAKKPDDKKDDKNAKGDKKEDKDK